jgi:uncharacterized delta-60 repeat protein
MKLSARTGLVTGSIGLVAWLSASPAAATGVVARYTAAGAVDTLFADTGELRFHNASLTDGFIDANQKIVVCGHVGSTPIVARYNANGTPDASFGYQGITLIPDVNSLETCAAAPVDKVVVLTRKGPHRVVVRLNGAGALDHTFGYLGASPYVLSQGRTLSAKGLFVRSNGQIVVGGTLTQDFPFFSGWYFTRFQSGGAEELGYGLVEGDTSYDYGNGLDAFTLDTAGNTIAVGRSWNGQGPEPGPCVAKITSTGQVDMSFGQGGKRVLSFTNDTMHTSVAIRVDPTGKIWVGGDHMAVARLLANGTPDVSFSSDGYARTSGLVQDTATFREGVFTMDVAIGSDGKAVLVGQLVHMEETSSGLLLQGWLTLTRHLPSGATDTSFGDQGHVIARVNHVHSPERVLLDTANRPIVIGNYSPGSQ